MPQETLGDRPENLVALNFAATAKFKLEAITLRSEIRRPANRRGRNLLYEKYTFELLNYHPLRSLIPKSVSGALSSLTAFLVKQD